MKKALLLFGTLGLALLVQACSSDLDETSVSQEPITLEVVTDSLSNTENSVFENGDLGKDLDKRK